MNTKQLKIDLSNLNTIESLLEYANINNLQVFNKDTVEILKADLLVSHLIKIDASSVDKESALLSLTILRDHKGLNYESN